MHEFQQIVMRFGFGQHLVQCPEKAGARRSRLEEMRQHGVRLPHLLVETGQVADNVVGGLAKDEFGDAGVFRRNAGVGNPPLEFFDRCRYVRGQWRCFDFRSHKPKMAEQDQQWRCGSDEWIGRNVLLAFRTKQNVQRDFSCCGRGQVG